MKPTEPGELLNVIVHLRKLMTAYDSANFVIRNSLEPLDEKAEDLAVTLRTQLTDTANGIYELLQRLEGLPAYDKLRKDILNGSKPKP